MERVTRRYLYRQQVDPPDYESYIVPPFFTFTSVVHNLFVSLVTPDSGVNSEFRFPLYRVSLLLSLL